MDYPGWNSWTPILKMQMNDLGLLIVYHASIIGSHIVSDMFGSPIHTKKLSNMLLADYGICIRLGNLLTVSCETNCLCFTTPPVHGHQEIGKLVQAMDPLWSHCAPDCAELAAELMVICSASLLCESVGIK
ncbi:MAG: hypothetical protein GDA36_05720 [Rhodobacteraceae bacterium]|nr:hypothetical protein [Paracoccaceae bacterium]